MQRNCLRRVIGTLCFLLLILAAHAQKYTVTGGEVRLILLLIIRKATPVADLKFTLCMAWIMWKYDILLHQVHINGTAIKIKQALEGMLKKYLL